MKWIRTVRLGTLWCLSLSDGPGLLQINVPRILLLCRVCEFEAEERVGLLYGVLLVSVV